MALCHNQGEHSEYQAELESDSRHQEWVGQMTAPTSQLEGKNGIRKWERASGLVFLQLDD